MRWLGDDGSPTCTGAARGPGGEGGVAAAATAVLPCGGVTVLPCGVAAVASSRRAKVSTKLDAGKLMVRAGASLVVAKRGSKTNGLGRRRQETQPIADRPRRA